MKTFRSLLYFCATVTLSSALTAQRPAETVSTTVATIEKLHQQDRDATLLSDPKALADLFTEDAVLLQPGVPPVIGKNGIRAENERDKVQHPTRKVLNYLHKIKGLQVFGGMAYEWGYFEVTYKDSNRADVRSLHGNSMRVLRRQADGSWKFCRVMWNQAP